MVETARIKKSAPAGLKTRKHFVGSPRVFIQFVIFSAGMNAGKKLGVEPLLKAKDVSSLNASHLGMMSYVSNFQWVKPRTRPSHTVRAHSDTHTTRVYKPVGSYDI